MAQKISTGALVLMVIGIILAIILSGIAIALPFILPGNQGVTGATGPQGIQGNPGATGPQGLPGTASNTGATGPPGPQGNQGIPGEQGIQGEQGIPGVTGPPGIQGIQGNTGPPGPTGPKGDPANGFEYSSVTGGTPINQLTFVPGQLLVIGNNNQPSSNFSIILPNSFSIGSTMTIFNNSPTSSYSITGTVSAPLFAYRNTPVNVRLDPGDSVNFAIISSLLADIPTTSGYAFIITGVNN